MAKYHGKDGVVNAGATAVAALRSWSLNLERTSVPAAQMGQDWVAHGVGPQAASGEIVVWHDPEDAGQTAIKDGADVALTLYPQGVGSGKPQFAFTSAIISARATSAEVEGWGEQTFSFVGNSAVDETAQT